MGLAEVANGWSVVRGTFQPSSGALYPVSVGNHQAQVLLERAGLTVHRSPHGMEELLHEHIVVFYSRPPSSVANLENMSQGLGLLAHITSVMCLRPLSCVTTEAPLM